MMNDDDGNLTFLDFGMCIIWTDMLEFHDKSLVMVDNVPRQSHCVPKPDDLKPRKCNALR